MTELKNLHILIAEDDTDDGEIVVQSFLNHPSFTKVNWVKNGKELLDFLEDRSTLKPDVILTDINMPLLNGIEALQEINKNAELKTIPVFVYSSTMNPVYEQKCKELGTKDYLTKPYDLYKFNEIPIHILSVLLKDKHVIL